MLGSIHPPKRETFDLVGRTNTDPKGMVRAVDVYTVRPWGLYMARPTPGRAQFHYLESWLLPSLGLRANIFHFNPGYERDQDYYLDVAQIATSARTWTSEDHYVDLTVHRGDRTDIVDVDELFEAHRCGLITTAAAETAIQIALAAVEGLATHDHDLDAWLAGRGMDLVWR